MIMNIAVTITRDMMPHLYIQMCSVKNNKKPDTTVDYWAFTPQPTAADREYFSDLISDDFRIHFEDVDQFRDRIRPPMLSYIFFVRCVLPSFLYKKLGRLLFMDCDAFCIGPGIEEFYNAPIDDLYVASAVDPTWTRSAQYMADMTNTRSKNYFNDGVMVLNLRKIHEDGIDEELVKWCRRWNHAELRCICADQTLLNYMLRDKVHLVSLRYNNTWFGSHRYALGAYRECFAEEGYVCPEDAEKDTVIVHFAGLSKPWKGFFRTGSQIAGYPNRQKAIALWADIKNNYARKGTP